VIVIAVLLVPVSTCGGFPQLPGFPRYLSTRQPLVHFTPTQQVSERHSYSLRILPQYPITRNRPDNRHRRPPGGSSNITISLRLDHPVNNQTIDSDHNQYSTEDLERECHNHLSLHRSRSQSTRRLQARYHSHSQPVRSRSHSKRLRTITSVWTIS